ncbi:MAG: DUF4367 domain-containing protein [Anaerobutyricum sp.]
MTYSNEKGDLIIYNQHDADYVISMAFDKQKDRKEEVSVCGVKGKYFTHEDKGVIIYEVNGVTYTIQRCCIKAGVNQNAGEQRKDRVTSKQKNIPTIVEQHSTRWGYFFVINK